MQIFNTYFRLLNRKKGSIMIYVGIFLALAIFFVMFSEEGNTVEEYSQQSVNIAVIDRDKSELSGSIKKYLAQHNKLVKIKDTKKSIQNELYWRNVEYVLIIPEKFQERVEKNEEVELISKKVADAINAAYVDEELNLFMNLLEMYQQADYNLEDAIQHVNQDVKQKAKIEMVMKADGESAEKTANTGYFYFRYLPYVLTAISIMVISSILIMFYQEDVKKRCICSSTKLKTQNKQLILANTIFCSGIAILFIILGIITTKGELLSQVNLLFYSINTLTFMLVTIALAFLIANLFHSEEAINGCCNVFSLGFCFLGGIFVSLSIMPDSVVTVAHFVPTYWYTQANEATSYMTKITSSFLKEFFLNVGVELCFAIALMCVALMVSKKRRVFA